MDIQGMYSRKDSFLLLPMPVRLALAPVPDAIDAPGTEYLLI